MPGTDLSLSSLAVFLTMSVPTSFVNLLINSASTVPFLATFFSTSIVLSPSSNVYPSTEMESTSSLIVYTPTGILLNSSVSPEATVNTYSSVSKVFLSDCRYNPALFFTEKWKTPVTLSLLLSVAVFLTLRLPTSCVKLFVKVTVELAVVVFDTVPATLVTLVPALYV